jgi:hypothetical protein
MSTSHFLVANPACYSPPLASGPMASFSDMLLNDSYSNHYDSSSQSQLFHYDCMLPNPLQQADVGRYSGMTSLASPFTDLSFSQCLLLPVDYSQILY